MSLSLQHRGRVPEVDQFDHALADHHVVGLNIPVGHSAAVQVGDGLRDFEGDLVAEEGGDCVCIVAEVILQRGCVGDELEQNVDLDM